MDNLKDLFDNSTNGVSLLLKEIQRIQPDLPPEKRDDSTFGALVVLHELSKARDAKLNRLQLSVSLSWLGMFLLSLVVLALHGDIPWLKALFEAVFGI